MGKGSKFGAAFALLTAMLASKAGKIERAAPSPSIEPPRHDWIYAAYYDPAEKEKRRKRSRPPFNRDRENARRRRQAGGL